MRSPPYNHWSPRLARPVISLNSGSSPYHEHQYPAVYDLFTNHTLLTDKMTIIKPLDRIVEFWQNEADADQLMRANFELYIAQGVLDSEGQPLTNVIWKIFEQSPRRTVLWEQVYGLNWCRELPRQNGTWYDNDLELSGTWQRCQVGQAFALSASGFWTSSPTQGVSKCLQISQNEYKASDKEGVYIVIGLYDRKTSGFDPVLQPVDSR